MVNYQASRLSRNINNHYLSSGNVADLSTPIPSPANAMKYATLTLGGMDNRRLQPKFAWLWDEEGNLFILRPDNDEVKHIAHQHRGLTAGSLADTCFRSASHIGNTFLLQSSIRDELRLFHSFDGVSVHKFSIFTSGVISADAWCNDDCSRMMVVVLTFEGLEWWIKDHDDDIMEMKYRQHFEHEFSPSIPQDPSAIVRLNPEGHLHAFILGVRGEDLTLTQYNGVDSNEMLCIGNGGRPKELRPALLSNADDKATHSLLEFAIAHGRNPGHTWKFFVFDPKEREFKLESTIENKEYSLYSYLYPEEMSEKRYITANDGKLGIKFLGNNGWNPLLSDSVLHPFLMPNWLCGISRKGADWVLQRAPLP